MVRLGINGGKLMGNRLTQVHLEKTAIKTVCVCVWSLWESLTSAFTQDKLIRAVAEFSFDTQSRWYITAWYKTVLSGAQVADS